MDEISDWSKDKKKRIPRMYEEKMFDFIKKKIIVPEY